MLIKNLFSKNVFILLLFVFTACTKDTGDNAPVRPPIGPIPADEFAAVPSPTYQQVIGAYDAITRENPSLIQNETILASSIFDWIKARPIDRVDIKPVFDLASKMTIEEWKLVILQPIKAYKVSKLVGVSLDAAKLKYSCDADVGFEDSKADALRHAYWNTLMVRNTDSLFAKDFATAHESESKKNPARMMDIHNNKFGRDLAIKYPTALDDQLLELLVQQKYFYLKNPDNAIPSGANGALVYFAAQRLYDGTFLGSFSNPDSGGPWDATFDFNQCDNLIRGQLTIIRGGDLQKRRFSGTINSTGGMTLNVSDPYVFENPRNLYYCTKMVMTLKGNDRSLQGNWISSNCSLGGVVNISR